MTYEEARQRTNERSYEVNAISGTYDWFSAIKTWEVTGQTICLEVWPKSNQFQLSHFVGAIRVTTDKMGSFSDDVQFLKRQMNFMQVLEKLK